MKNLQLGKAFGMLSAVIILITSCQKDYQNTTINPESPTQQEQRQGGVAADKTENEIRVPLMISANAMKTGSNVFSPLVDASQMRGKPAKTGDTNPPAVNITSPENASTVTGTVTIKVSASDNVGVSSVSLFINGVLLSTLNAAPYNFSWNSSIVADGTHNIMATARDAAGNASSFAITVAKNTTVVVVPPVNLPSSYQLLTPPVGNQGGEGSCVAFAVGYATRSIEQYYRTNASSFGFASNIFSPEFLYNQIKFGTDCGSGTGMTTALDFIKANGITTFQTMPYSSTNGCSLMPTNSQNAEAANFKINSYSKIIFSDRQAIKTALTQNHPLIINVLADNSFVNAKTGFTWSSYSGSGALPHCIIICGYDDSRNAYKVMNSWGTGWGDAGFTWIDYDHLATVSSYYFYLMN
jgi:hypothetical protein